MHSILTRLILIAFSIGLLSLGTGIIEPFLSDDWLKTFAGHFKYDALSAALTIGAFAAAHWLGSRGWVKSKNIHNLQLVLATIGLLALVGATGVIIVEGILPNWALIGLIGGGNVSIAGAFFLRGSLTTNQENEYLSGEVRFKA